jgi:hypothetical protein
MVKVCQWLREIRQSLTNPASFWREVESDPRVLRRNQGEAAFPLWEAVQREPQAGAPFSLNRSPASNRAIAMIRPLAGIIRSTRER